MYLLSEIPSQWAPSKPYRIDENIEIYHAGIIEHNTKQIMANYCKLSILTTNLCREDHINALRKILPIFSFLFSDPVPCVMTENGSSLIAIELKEKPDLTCYKGNFGNLIDFDNISKAMYFMQAPEISVSFKYFYDRLTTAIIDRATLFIDTNNQLFKMTEISIFNRSFQTITSYCILLEELIGIAPNCDEKIKCPLCNKQVPPHRKYSVKEWTDRYLMRHIPDNNLATRFAEVIQHIKNIRNTSSHKVYMPNREMKPSNLLGIIPLPKEKSEYESDNKKLTALLFTAHEITKQLMIHHYFNVSFFYFPDSLKSVQIKI